MEVGKRLRELMDRKAITAYELSKITGISQAALSRLFNDETAKPNIKNAELLSKYFEVSREWLLTGEGELPGSNVTTTTNDMIDEARISKLEKEVTLLLDLVMEIRGDVKTLKEQAEKKKKSA